MLATLSGRDASSLRFDAAGLVSLHGEPFVFPRSSGRLHITGQSPLPGELVLDRQEGGSWEPFVSVRAHPGMTVAAGALALPAGTRLRLRLETRSRLLPTSAEFSARVAP